MGSKDNFWNKDTQNTLDKIIVTCVEIFHQNNVYIMIMSYPRHKTIMKLKQKLSIIIHGNK